MSSTYAFFSVKGGVGKSALAAAAAVAFARTGRAVAVVDGDLSGTSLADGLALCAPEGLPDGAVAWSGPATPHLTRAQTVARRRDLAEDAHAPGLPFFDAVVAGPTRQGFDPVAIAWVHEDVPAVRWYPSSPAPRHVTAAIQAMFRDEKGFGVRLGWALGAIRESVGSDGVLLVDLPPGMFGVGTWVAQDGVTPVLVTTSDRNDLFRSVHEQLRLRRRFPDTRWLLNRNQRAAEAVRRDLREYLGPLFPGREHDLREVGWDSDLSRVFQEDHLHVSTPLGDRILQLLEDR